MTAPGAAFVRIPGGEFLMGSDEGQDDERPPHRVRVDAFDLAVYPVTQAEYAAFLDATAHDVPRDWTGVGAGEDLPVTGVSWLDAVAYCDWRSGDGVIVRLPTEAEWERAARGGVDGVRYPWGEEIPAWLPEGGRGPLASPWPVTMGPPTVYGLHGIGANIHEWCADWHDAGFYARSPVDNPAGPPGGERKASRGGAWRHAITISRTSARSRIAPALRYTDYGFRVARTRP